MPSYVILDTSIYRELGLKFFENIDYLNLSGFTIATDTELLISTIVKEEFYNYYKVALFKKLQDYNNAIAALKRDPIFRSDKVSFSNINRIVSEALKNFEKKISAIPNHVSAFATLKHTQIDSLELTKFILEAKNNGINNIQLRDYLIWDSIIKIAVKESKTRIESFGESKIRFERGKIYFITSDKIFSESVYFKDKLKHYRLTNVEIFKSIPEFLHKKGYNVPFLTPELILTTLSNFRILKDLKEDILALITYVSSIYNFLDENQIKVLSSEIIGKEIVEFYSYKDDLDKKPKFVAHIKVHVNVLYDTVKIDKGTDNDDYGLNTFDNEGRLGYL